MKFLYDRSLSHPQVDKDFTHCHCRLFSRSKKPGFFDREYRTQMRNDLDGEVRSIKICMAFLNEYKNNPSLTDVQRAEISAAIESDKLFMEALEQLKPAQCNIS